mmetsp:Transcript_41542/g.47217  ORF Transcript_41542/g.47217 Transcript_41542/m.47217 type:complete len:87 (-) Transcript_41542:1192-1452(-)
MACSVHNGFHDCNKKDCPIKTAMEGNFFARDTRIIKVKKTPNAYMGNILESRLAMCDSGSSPFRVEFKRAWHRTYPESMKNHGTQV